MPKQSSTQSKSSTCSSAGASVKPSSLCSSTTSKQVASTSGRPSESASKSKPSACSPDSTAKATPQRPASVTVVKPAILKRKLSQTPKDGQPPSKLKCSVVKSTSTCTSSFGHSSTQLQESRLTRIHRLFSSPQTQLYALFLKYSNEIFHNINLLLQREEPCIHILHRELNAVFKDLLVRFVKPAVIYESSADMKKVQFSKGDNQKSDEDLMIGKGARDYIKRMSDTEANPTHLTKQDKGHFYRSVRRYYQSACDYILRTWPLSDKLLQEAEVVDISLRSSRSFGSVEYFVDKFPGILGDQSSDVVDKLEVEFATYQVDSFSDKPAVFESIRVDKKWDLISRITDGSGCKKYPLLSRVAKAVLVIPHSNAACERVFSIVRKNKTDFRSSMSTKTLQALLTEKIANSGVPCYQREFSKGLLKKVKQATYHSLRERDLQIPESKSRPTSPVEPSTSRQQ